jgi:CBS domain-containing protein
MSLRVNEVMTQPPTAVAIDATLRAAARTMRDLDIGDVVVVEDGRPVGIVTDRDIVVRGLALGLDAETTGIGDICSRDLATLSPKDSVDDAERLMREKSLRRVPVVEKGTLMGVVSIGDLARVRDPDSALAEISAAPPNR